MSELILPNRVLVKSRHHVGLRLESALKALHGDSVQIEVDFSRFKSDTDDTEIIPFILGKNREGVLVYVTTYNLSCILACLAGCKFGTFERFELGRGSFCLRQITHYNDPQYLVVSVLRYDDPSSWTPDLSRVPICLP